MTRHYIKAELRAAAHVPARPAPCAPRMFDLHPALHIATFGAYAVFLGIMAAAFMNRELIIPFAIFFTFVGMAYATPAAWARIAPPAQGRRQSWDEFLRTGVDCATGRLGGGAAVVQVMILPVLLIVWAIAVAIIRASV